MVPSPSTSRLPGGRLRRERLRNWNPRRPVSELLQAFLEDFLETSGYHEIGAAVAGTLGRIRSQPRAAENGRIGHADRLSQRRDLVDEIKAAS
jgi:hypothetical protein